MAIGPTRTVPSFRPVERLSEPPPEIPTKPPKEKRRRRPSAVPAGESSGNAKARKPSKKPREPVVIDMTMLDDDDEPMAGPSAPHGLPVREPVASTPTTTHRERHPGPADAGPSNQHSHRHAPQASTSRAHSTEKKRPPHPLSQSITFIYEQPDAQLAPVAQEEAPEPQPYIAPPSAEDQNQAPPLIIPPEMLDIMQGVTFPQVLDEGMSSMPHLPMDQALPADLDLEALLQATLKEMLGPQSSEMPTEEPDEPVEPIAGPSYPQEPEQEPDTPVSPPSPGPDIEVDVDDSVLFAPYLQPLPDKPPSPIPEYGRTKPGDTVYDMLEVLVTPSTSSAIPIPPAYVPRYKQLRKFQKTLESLTLDLLSLADQGMTAASAPIVLPTYEEIDAGKAEESPLDEIDALVLKSTQKHLLQKIRNAARAIQQLGEKFASAEDDLKISNYNSGIPT